MRVCPECGYEYKDTVIKCPDCDEQLITKKQKEEKEKRYKNWESVYTAGTLYEAEMIKSNLLSAAIECVILNQKDRSFQVSGDLGIVKIMVPKDKVSDALVVIENSESYDDEDEIQENYGS
jgi:predicted ATP-dependent serine protease